MESKVLANRVIWHNDGPSRDELELLMNTISTATTQSADRAAKAKLWNCLFALAGPASQLQT